MLSFDQSWGRKLAICERNKSEDTSKGANGRDGREFEACRSKLERRLYVSWRGMYMD